MIFNHIKKSFYAALLSLFFFDARAQCPTNATDLQSGGPYNITTNCTAISGGNLDVTETITIASGGTLTLTVTNFVRMSGASITVESGGTLIINGTGGTLALTDASTLQVDAGGDVQISGDIDVGHPFAGNAGTVTLNGDMSVGGDFDLNDQGSIDGSGELTVTGDINENAGSDDSGFTGTSSCSGTCSTLPVELMSFYGAQSGEQTVALYWSTASEQENEGFCIEKSLDGYHFEEIGFVEGHGTTNATMEYEYVDADGTLNAYYRLRQIDFDGGYELYHTIYITISDQEDIAVYPNPIESDFVSLSGASDVDFEISLIDVSGSEVLKAFGQLSDIEAALNNELPGLKPSVYIMRVLSSKGVSTIRLIRN